MICASDTILLSGLEEFVCQAHEIEWASWWKLSTRPLPGSPHRVQQRRFPDCDTLRPWLAGSRKEIYLASAIYALGIGEDQLELLGKLGETAAGVSGGGDQDFGVTLSCVRVLVIDMSARHRCVVILQLHLATKSLLLLPQLVGDGFALCER